MRLLMIHPGADYATSDVYDGLKPALERRGVECVPFALNARIDRAASWLRHIWTLNGEDGPAPSDADVAYQAGVGAIERALRLRVDWVFVVSAQYLHPDVIILLRRAGLKIALLLTESPYESDSERALLPYADVAWTNERSCVEPYRDTNADLFYLPHAYDPERHRPHDPDAPRSPDLPAHDVVFVGTPFPERVELLEAIDWHGIDLGLYGFWDEATSERSPLRAHHAGGVVSNEEAAALYRNARIGLNLFRSSRDFESGVRVQGAESMNPRNLELAACQVFQISEWRPEVEEVFGSSVPTFRTPEELQRQLRWFLSDPDAAFLRHRHAAAARIAVTGRDFDARAEQVLSEMTLVSQEPVAV